MLMQLESYEYGSSSLVLNLKMPMLKEKYLVEAISMTNERVLNVAIARLVKKNNIEQDALYECIFKLESITEDINDSFCFQIKNDTQEYKLYVQADVIKRHIKTIKLSSGKTKDIYINREIDGICSIQISSKIYEYILSVVTAVYNTAPFLPDMINSVLNQKGLESLNKYVIGNKTSDYGKRCCLDYFELILVDDGSDDGSEAILDDYANKDERIKAIHQNNGGTASARNRGIKISQGKYINFVDSDDILSPNFMTECINFYEQHEKISMITVPIVFFDAAQGEHWTNYKFTGQNRVVNLMDEPNNISLSVSCSIFKNENIFFEPSIVIGEDSEFIYGKRYKNNTLVGLVNSTAYYYRRRTIGEKSIIQNSSESAASYMEYLCNVLERIADETKNEDGTLPKYVQYYLMGQLQWKFSVSDRGMQAKKILGEEGFRQYKEKAYELLRLIDDDIIMQQRKIWVEVKYFIIKKKHRVFPQIVEEDHKHYFNIMGNIIPRSLEHAFMKLEIMEVKYNVLHIEGYVKQFEPDVKFLVLVDGKIVQYRIIERDVNTYSFDEICYYGYPFAIDLELDMHREKYEISFANVYKGVNYGQRSLRFTKIMPISEMYNKSYYLANEWVIRKEDNKLIVRNLLQSQDEIDYEEEFIDEVQNKMQSETTDYIIKLRTMARQYLASPQRRKVCLFMDRLNVAGDNGEALFRYVNKLNNENIYSVFVIEKDSIDYERLKEFGKVVAYKSEEYFYLRLIADYVISSAGDEFIINPWFNELESTNIVKDLLSRTQWIFLQHGVTVNDISGWLNRYQRNLKGLVCAATREKQAILKGKYFYLEKEVWLTGFPRHDLLYNDCKKKIVIMPTWRKELNIPGTTSSEVSPYFNQSRYFLFYNKMINNDRLLDVAEELGYKVCFMPHPEVKRHGLQYFDKDDRVEFLGFENTYRQVFAEASMVITDYSSAVMDFVMLKKPVVYCQFDRDTFFENHLCKKGYFDYVSDGLGEVTYDMEACIDLMIEYMKQGCKMHEPYISRVDAFFTFNNFGNCERVYEKIKELMEI